MKESDQTVDPPLTWSFDQSWVSFQQSASFLRLNDTLDFSDLWEEDEPGLASSEDDGTGCANQTSACPRAPPLPPPLPPCAPPLPPASPMGRPAVERRTLKLHWKELQSLPPLPRVTRFGSQTIWAGLEPVLLDTNQLEYLFETKGNGNVVGAVGGWRRQPSVSVLAVKRSNIITIALSSLPPPRLLPPAIYSMDGSVLDREDVQRLQTLVPSEEELCLIQEATAQSPRSSLAPAEQCLLILGDIPHLSSRLQLWAFALDYDTLESEIAEPLFHLKLAMEQLAANQTFRCILATVLAIGNFLNGCKARGFELSYLGKLSQVRDTHSRQPLLYHVCVLLLQLYPQSSDLYSDISAVTKASKCDYSSVQTNLAQLEALCKASWEQLRLLDRVDEKKKGGKGGEKRRAAGGDEVAAPEGSLRPRLSRFLKECEERMKVLRAVHRRVVNRFNSFLLFLGYSQSMVRETTAEDFCKTVSNFSLEYRSTRHAILQQRERERERREREAAVQPTARLEPEGNFNRLQHSVEQCELEEVLRTPESAFRPDLTLPRSRRRVADTKGPFSRKMKW